MEKINVEERSARAKELFKSGYTCCQAVVSAYSDLFDIDPTTAAVMAAPFGGGMGRLREVCGGASGMFMIAGMYYRLTDPTDKTTKTALYTAVQELAASYRQENGSIVCRELLGLAVKSEAPVPEDRTPEYYKRRPCAEYVACAARIVGEFLNKKEEEKE